MCTYDAPIFCEIKSNGNVSSSPRLTAPFFNENFRVSVSRSHSLDMSRPCFVGLPAVSLTLIKTFTAKGCFKIAYR